MNSYLIVAAFSYLLGSIPFGYLLVRIFKGVDVRASGSGNIGATNVARTSRSLGLATLLLDAAKGMAAVLVTRAFFPSPSYNLALLTTVAAFFAVFGHLFSAWLKFRGGKGVATSLGAFILLTPKSILCMFALFLIVTVVFRYVSLGSVVAAIAFPILTWGFHEYSDSRQLILIAVIAALVLWKHRKNIARLAAGTEGKIARNSIARTETDSTTLEASRQ
jgi:acyl phosphate:glycerol-3-phosphate acyltransferase